MKFNVICVKLICTLFLSLVAHPILADEDREKALVGGIGASGQSESTMTRAELDEHVKRFADRYYTRMVIAIDSMRTQSFQSRELELLQTWRALSSSTAVGIAIGRNAVTNLLDMMVLTTLGRMVMEDYYLPEVWGEEKAKRLLTASIALEEDIWTVANDVLTADQQKALLSLISDWHAQNPDQIYPWLMRMSMFSGQRAVQLGKIKKSGGLMKEVRAARETAEEVRELSERSLFYIQRAPRIVSDAMEESVLKMLNGPHVEQMLKDTGRFVTAVEDLVEEIEALPLDRLALIDQALEGIDKQRRALVEDIATALPETRAALADLRATAEVTERIVSALESDEATSEPINIAEYQALSREVAGAAIELRGLVEAINNGVAGSTGFSAAIDLLTTGQAGLIDRFFILMGILITFFFVCMLGYRLTAARLDRV